MKNTILSLSLFFTTLILLSLQSCSDNRCNYGANDRYINYNIPDSNKAKIPYTGTDTLIFVSDVGDTATLIGHGKNTYYKTVTRDLGFSADCPGTEYSRYENVDYEFSGNNPMFDNLILRLYMYEKIVPKHPYLEVKTTQNFRVLGSFEYSHGSDSILLNGSFVNGVFIDDASTILFNNTLGILKFNKINNSTWIKIQ